ncbi:outer membrane beta-barrel domain-containing protein [bacterium]|nr:outer membrane beta-barrel domain-containing protein [bacterium]
MRKLLAFSILCIALQLQAAETPTQAAAPSLEDQLSALQTPGNQAPAGVTGEQLYAVQNRYVPLRFRHEFALGGGNNFTPDSFLISTSIDASYRFYLSDRWFVGLSGNYVFNDLTVSGKDADSILARVPDVTVVKYRGDLQLGYNLFYGKFRLSMDQVFYFDQYIALGPGIAVMDKGRSLAAVADVGLALWFGRNFDLRVGFKDYFFNELRSKTPGWGHNILGYVQAGYLFGG